MKNTTTAPAGPVTRETLAAVRDIRDLTHEYSRAVDAGDLDGILEVFTEDAEWDTTAFGMGVERGHDALRTFFASLIENMPARCHMALNHRITVDGDSATGTVYLHAFVVTPDGRRDESIGYYADTYARTDRGWRIRRRAAHALMAPPPVPVQ